MKKKFFSLLLLLILVIPFNVKADFKLRGAEISSVEIPKVFSGDEIIFTISAVDDLTGGTITFDEKVLEFVDVAYTGGDDVWGDDEIGKVTSNKDGKLVIKLTNTKTTGFVFKVKADAKLGNSSIKFEVFDKEKVNDSMTTNEMTREFKVIKEQTTTDNEKEEKTPDKSEESKTVSKTETTEKDNMLFYISLGANAVLLLGIIILALKKKN